MPILAVIGIDTEGKRDILAFCTGERENQNAWEELLEQLKERGVEQIDLWCTDDNKAMLSAIQNKVPVSKRQRCIKHKWKTSWDIFPEKHWKFIRTTNAIERLFGEVKKRSHKMSAAFRNENSCMLMFYAVIRSLKLRRISIPTRDTSDLQKAHNS